VLVVVSIAIYLMVDWSLIFSSYTVSGIVLDQDGKPAPGIRLTFHSSEIDAFQWKKYYEKTVICYSRSDGTFKVGSPYAHLELRGIEAKDYIGELNDESLQKGYTRATRNVQLHVYSTVAKQRVIDHTRPRTIEPTGPGVVLLDLTTGDVAVSSSSADLEITFRPLAIEVRAVKGGVRISGSEAIYAPVGDYIEGVRASWVNYPAMHYSPMYVSGFFESQNQKHVGHFDLLIDVPDKGLGLSKIRIQTLMNVEGGRTLGRPLVGRDAGFDHRNSAGRLVLTESPWWSHPSGVQPILSRQQGLAALGSVTAGSYPSQIDDALARSQTDDAVYTAILNRDWSKDRGVLRSLAENPSVPDSILWKLATHPELTVRRTVASLKRCPQPLLEQLSRDRDGTVRQAATQPNGESSRKRR
jgi:hypothetical protein